MGSAVDFYTGFTSFPNPPTKENKSQRRKKKKKNQALQNKPSLTHKHHRQGKNQHRQGKNKTKQNKPSLTHKHHRQGKNQHRGKIPKKIRNKIRSTSFSKGHSCLKKRKKEWRIYLGVSKKRRIKCSGLWSKSRHRHHLFELWPPLGWMSLSAR